MDIVGFVIGVVTAWETAVHVFEIIDSGKKYGMDYEVLRVKLEVERIRLMIWGEAVGLSEVERGRPSPDPRLNREQVRSVVLRLLHQENRNFLFGILRHLLILSSALGGFFYLHVLSKIFKSSYK